MYTFSVRSTGIIDPDKQGCGVDRIFIGVDSDSGVGIFMSTPTPTPTCLE